MPQLFGINNCDTVKKAKRWLTANHVHFDFHDFRVDGLTEQQVQQWVAHVGWEALLNKRSTTWRQLSEAQKQDCTEQTVIALLCEHPTLIKRPVLQHIDTVLVGFKAETYQRCFQ